MWYSLHLASCSLSEAYDCAISTGCLDDPLTHLLCVHTVERARANAGGTAAITAPAPAAAAAAHTTCLSTDPASR